MSSRIFPHLAAVAVAALVGLSLAKVSSGDPWVYSIGAAVISLVAVVIASAFRQQSASFEKATPPRKTLGLRIGIAGFVIALCGWLVGVFLSATVGYYIVAIGVVTGFVGFPVHIYNMFRT